MGGGGGRGEGGPTLRMWGGREGGGRPHSEDVGWIGIGGWGGGVYPYCEDVVMRERRGDIYIL